MRALLSYSGIKCFMRCNREYYHRYVIKDTVIPPSPAHSRGALLDAIVTKGFRATPGAAVNKEVLRAALASTYGDGSEHVGNLLLKSGGFGKEASRVLEAGLRLMEDPAVRKMMEKAKTQVTLEGKVAGYAFNGTPDIITTIDGLHYIVDVKKTSSQRRIWAECGIGDPKSPPYNKPLDWWDAYDYWMQLAVYKLLYLQNNPNVKEEDLRTGLLAASEETDDVSLIEYVPLAAPTCLLEDIIHPYITALDALNKGGWKGEMNNCGECIVCRKASKIDLDQDTRVPYIRYVVPEK